MELIPGLAVGHASILPVKHTADVRASLAPITQLSRENALCHQADMLLLAVHLCLQVQQPGIAHACSKDHISRALRKGQLTIMDSLRNACIRSLALLRRGGQPG